jgi:N-methylhydantoinase A
VGDGAGTEGLIELLTSGFDRCYAALYGRTEKDTPAEVVSWRVVVQGPTPDLTPAVTTRAVPNAEARAIASSARKGSRRVYSVARGAFAETDVYDRYKLAPGARLDGPAIVEERESTVVVPDGAVVTIDQYHNMMIDLPVQAE